MGKALFFNVPTTGHVNPSLPVVAELVRRGEHVIYYLTEHYRAKVEAAGAEFRAYANLSDDYFVQHGLDGGNPLLTARVLAGTTQAMLPDLLATIQREQPDYILYDAMCPWGGLAARIGSVPSVSSMALFILTPRMLLKSGQFLDLAKQMFKSRRDLRELQSVLRDIARTYHIRTPGLSDILTSTGTITISYTSSLFQPGGHRMDNSIRFVGPSIEPRTDGADFPFDQLDERPLIYISLGTVINHNLDFYRDCLRAFADSPCQVVMSVGRTVNLADLGQIPANFIVCPFVPQLDILQRASLFITHAGMNSVHEGLYYQVPLVLVPQQSEQNLVANRTAELLAGIKLDRAAVSADRLRTAAEKVLSDETYRQQAARLGQSLHAAGGYQRAADEILRLVQ